MNLHPVCLSCRSLIVNSFRDHTQIVIRQGPAREAVSLKQAACLFIGRPSKSTHSNEGSQSRSACEEIILRLTSILPRFFHGDVPSQLDWFIFILTLFNAVRRNARQVDETLELGSVVESSVDSVIITG